MAQQLCLASCGDPGEAPVPTEVAIEETIGAPTQRASREAPPAAPFTPPTATVLPTPDHRGREAVVRESRRWAADGWTARIFPIEGDAPWAVEMRQDGEPEAVLIAPWQADRDLRNPRPLDQSAFDALLKTATQILQRQARQLHTLLHKRLSVEAPEGSWEVTLDIVPDEYEPYARLAAFDESGAQRAQQRVRADFPLTTATARAWIKGDFRPPGQEEA